MMSELDPDSFLELLTICRSHLETPWTAASGPFITVTWPTIRFRRSS